MDQQPARHHIRGTATAPQATWSGRHVVLELLTSGIAVASATALTNPIDLVKTRMQLQALQARGPPTSMVSMALRVVRDEGVGALWRGLAPAITRGLMYGGLRLGLYTPIKEVVSESVAASSGGGATDSDALRSSSGSKSSGSSGSGTSSSGDTPRAPFSVKLLAGCTSGGLAAAISSPTELVKVRLQAAGSGRSSASQVVRSVVAQQGLRGLWQGASPGVARAAALTASQVATYDEVKHRLMAATGWGESATTHGVCALLSGLVTCTATTPFDMVKTRVMGGGFSGPLACVAFVHREGGARAFMRGWSANYVRLAPQTVITFVVGEWLRERAGLHAL